MADYALFVVFCLGAIVGSFLNVVIYRLHTGRSTNGRSHCMSCARSLAWYELVPIVSYLALRGHCRACKAYIPVRYVLVEVLTGTLFALVFLAFRYDMPLLFLNVVAVSVLVVILVYDLRHTIIPDEAVAVLLAAAVGIAGYTAYYSGDATGTVTNVVLAAVIGAGFLGGLWLVSGGRWMGLGDAKLMFPLALMAGPFGALTTIVLAFWIGAGVSLTLMSIQWLAQKGTTHLALVPFTLTMKSEIPFAPFLILGFFCSYFFHGDLFTITQLLFG